MGSFPETYNDHNFHGYAKETNRKSMTVSEEISIATDPKSDSINKESDSTTY